MKQLKKLISIIKINVEQKHLFILMELFKANIVLVILINDTFVVKFLDCWYNLIMWQKFLLSGPSRLSFFFSRGGHKKSLYGTECVT